MANIFSGNVEKEIPKNLKECYKTDAVTQNLWTWCERIEKFGFILCILLGIIGIIEIVSNGIEMSNLIRELDIEMDEIRTVAAEYDIEIKSVFQVVIEGIFTWVFYCFIEYCTYHIIALLIGALATIVQHTKISANVAIYKVSISEKEDRKPEAPEVLNDGIDLKKENIVCPVCNFEQRARRKVCWQCGAKLVADDQDPISHYWLCDGCKKMRSQSPCEHCGKD